MTALATAPRASEKQPVTNTTNASHQPEEDVDDLIEDDAADFGPPADVIAVATTTAIDDEDEEDEEDDEDDEDEEDETDEVEDEDPEAKATRASRSEPSDSDLFRQSEIAADYIEGLLDILDFDGDIDELVQNGRPMVEVVGARLNNLIGTRGATLEALQELSRLAVYRQTGEPSRLLLDVGGFRAARRKELVAVAKNAAEKVKQHGESVRLEPMSAFERKCVHDVINALSGVESESEGVEPSRRIVVRAIVD